MENQDTLPQIFVIPGTNHGIDAEHQLWKLNAEPIKKLKRHHAYKDLTYSCRVNGKQSVYKALTLWNLAMENPIVWYDGMYRPKPKVVVEQEDDFDTLPFEEVEIDYDTTINDERTGVFYREKLKYFEANIAHSKGVFGLGYYTDYRLAKMVLELALEDVARGNFYMGTNHRKWWMQLQGEDPNELQEYLID